MRITLATCIWIWSLGLTQALMAQASITPELFICKDSLLPSSIIWDIREQAQEMTEYPWDQVEMLMNDSSYIQAATPIAISWEKKITDLGSKEGAHELQFIDVSDHGEDYVSFLDLYPLNLKAHLDIENDFGIHWLAGIDKIYQTPVNYYLSHEIYHQGDTIISFTNAPEMGGYTPEGAKFYFDGPYIDSIQVKSKVIFNAMTAIDLNFRDDWYYPMRVLESKWFEPQIEGLTFQLPIIKGCLLPDSTFTLLKTEAIDILEQEFLPQKDSLLLQDDQYFQHVIAKALEKLAPNLNEAERTDELLIHLELLYFVNKITLHMRNGKTQEYTHFAHYGISVP